MIDLLLKLIDKLIDLAKRREEQDKTLFVNFVQPAFQTFEAVHTDYIDSLIRYNTRLMDTTLAMDLLHPVFSDIGLDALKTEHFRTKLADFRPTEAKHELSTFLKTIQFYLNGLTSSGDHVNLFNTMLAGMQPTDTKYGLLRSLLIIGDKPLESLPSTPAFRHFVFSDPMRLVLRTTLGLIDAPGAADDDEDLAQLEDVARHFRYNLSDQQRRDLCASAIGSIMSAFQLSYAAVSAEYSALRAKMMV